MGYRITKECGVGWDEDQPTEASAWGVSENQRRLAEKVVQGDILLHYIDHAHAWAGYSTVSGPLQKNDRDHHVDWLAALPYVFPIERGVWLKEGQCESTVVISRLSNKQYNRQVAFTLIDQGDAELIIEAINTAKAVQPTASPAFHQRWLMGAENYYKGIVKGLTSRKCGLCGNDAVSWAAQMRLSISKYDEERIRDALLDAAHIVPNCDLGPMTPDNLRALCPNCHRVVDRLPNEQREMLLRKK